MEKKKNEEDLIVEYQKKNQPLLKEQQLIAQRIKAPNGKEIRLKPLEFDDKEEIIEEERKTKLEQDKLD